MKMRYLNFYSITGALFFAYVFTRAITVGVTYDEAWTLMDFVPVTVEHVLSCNPCDANNHLLNTLLIKLVYLFTPDTLFWARIPNVLAFVLYLVVACKIGKKYLPNPFGLLFFILMLANPFLLDFFSLARGYGLSISFMLASILFLLKYRETLNWKHACAGLGLASLAVLGNFVLLNYWFGAFFVIYVFAIKEGFNKKLLLKLTAASFVLSLLVLAFTYESVRKLLLQDGFYFGGKMGFYQETINSLTRYSLYSPYSNEMAEWVSGVLSVILAIAILLGFKRFTSLKEIVFSKAALITYLIAIPILSNVMQNVLLDTLFLIARTALFYFPLIVAVLLFWMGEAKSSLRIKLNMVMGIIMTLVCCFNFLANANFHKTITWEFDSHNREILTELQAKAERESRNYTVGAVRLYIRGVLYQIDDFPNLQFVPEQNVKDSVSTDYYIHYNRDLPRIGYFSHEMKILTYEKDTVMQFPDDGVYVFSNFRKKDGS